jgi:hypothetical protein
MDGTGGNYRDVDRGNLIVSQGMLLLWLQEVRFHDMKMSIVSL